MTRSKNNISALSLMRHLGEAYNSALLVKQKMMEVMSEAYAYRFNRRINLRTPMSNLIIRCA